MVIQRSKGICLGPPSLECPQCCLARGPGLSCLLGHSGPQLIHTQASLGFEATQVWLGVKGGCVGLGLELTYRAQDCHWGQPLSMSYYLGLRSDSRICHMPQSLIRIAGVIVAPGRPAEGAGEVCLHWWVCRLPATWLVTITATFQVCVSKNESQEPDPCVLIQHASLLPARLTPVPCPPSSPGGSRVPPSQSAQASAHLAQQTSI